MATIQDAMAIGWKLIEARDLPRAEQVYLKVIELDPTVAQAWFLLGAVNHLQEKVDAAADAYERALRIEPGHVEALNNLGVALHAQGKITEAVACLRRAIAAKPDYADAHSNLGNAYQEHGQLDLAVNCYRHALKLNSGYFDAHNNLGNALRAQGKLEESVVSYERALEVRPDHPQVRLSRALSWLQMGDFERGWAEYEWRFQCADFSIPAFRQPVWDGGQLRGRTILLYADHGLGDSLQFVRYARLAKARGGRVLVTCQQPLARLMANCEGVDHVIPEGQTLSEFDVYAPLMSLPRILGTTLASVPAEVPYLHADPILVDRWRRQVEPAGGFRVGIAWQGNPRYRRDRQRSFRLTQFEPLADLAGVRLFSLQKGAGTEQIGALNGRFDVADIGSSFADFMDCAAVMRNLDLVITPDTSLTHLAGALGVPTWVAIPTAPDWRWLTGRDDNPWYPTLRLFRQRTWGDWDEVFRRLATALAARIAAE